MAFGIRKIDKAAREELEKIREKSGGTLIPELVVEYAKKKNNPLHKYFSWDDSEAARLYRLQQARAVISVVVKVIPGTQTTVRAYVSVSNDRADAKKAARVAAGKPEPDDDMEKATEYREITDVLSDEGRRRMLLADAYADLANFRRKYIVLTELAGLFKEIDKVLAV